MRDRAKTKRPIFRIYIVADWIAAEPIKIQCMLCRGAVCVSRECVGIFVYDVLCMYIKIVAICILALFFVLSFFSY